MKLEQKTAKAIDFILMECDSVRAESRVFFNSQIVAISIWMTLSATLLAGAFSYSGVGGNPSIVKTIIFLLFPAESCLFSLAWLDYAVRIKSNGAYVYKVEAWLDDLSADGIITSDTLFLEHFIKDSAHRISDKAQKNKNSPSGKSNLLYYGIHIVAFWLAAVVVPIALAFSLLNGNHWANIERVYVVGYFLLVVVTTSFSIFLLSARICIGKEYGSSTFLASSTS